MQKKILRPKTKNRTHIHNVLNKKVRKWWMRRLKNRNYFFLQFICPRIFFSIILLDFTIREPLLVIFLKTSSTRKNCTKNSKHYQASIFRTRLNLIKSHSKIFFFISKPQIPLIRLLTVSMTEFHLENRSEIVATKICTENPNGKYGTSQRAQLPHVID